MVNTTGKPKGHGSCISKCQTILPIMDCHVHPKHGLTIYNLGCGSNDYVPLSRTLAEVDELIPLATKTMTTVASCYKPYTEITENLQQGWFG